MTVWHVRYAGWDWGTYTDYDEALDAYRECGPYGKIIEEEESE